MSDALHARVRELVDPPMMVWVLEDSLDHRSLVELCRSCAITYQGARIQSIPSRRLISDLSDLFYKDDANAPAILKALKSGNQGLLEQFRDLTAVQIGSIVSDEARLLAEDRVGNVVLALAVDPRPEVRDMLKVLVDHLRAMSQDLHAGTASSEPRVQETGNRSDEPQRSTRKRTESADVLTRRLNRLEVANAALERKLAHRPDECQALTAAVKALKSENAALQATNSQLMQEKLALQESLQAAQHHNDGYLLPRLIRKYQQSEQPDAAHQASPPHPLVCALAQAVLDLKSYVEASAVQNAQEREELRQALQGISTQLAAVPEPTRPKPRSARQTGASARVGLFVDVQNMFYGAKEFNARVDFDKLLKRALANRRLVKAIAYVVESPEVDQSGFIAMLQQKNYEVKRKGLRSRSNGSAKGDWDMGIAIDVMTMADKLDVVALVTGDGDFVSLVKLVKTIGPYVEVFSFPHNTARDLVLAADEYCPIEQDLLLRPDHNGP